MHRDEAPSPRRFSSSHVPSLLLIPLAILMGAGQVSGQTPIDRVQDFLASASGFQLLGEVHTGFLAQGQTQGISLPFVEGSDYMVVGFCGAGCGNLDLALFDPSGEQVQADQLPDSEPVLTFTPEMSGLFHIQADMAGCSLNRCTIAVGVLGSSQEPGVPPGEDMAGRLTLFTSDIASRGFTEVGDPRRGALGTDQAVRIPLTLQAGLEYRIVGVCDIDCFDLDLVLWDQDDNQLAADFMEDDVPVLALIPASTEAFALEVAMVACDLEPCAFQVGVYARGEVTGPEEAPFSGELNFFETYEGSLEVQDQKQDGAYLDVYEVPVRAGQRLIVDLRSDEFDTLVRILDPEGQAEENDDYGTEAGHSHLEILALTDGIYRVHATSIGPEGQGRYRIQIAIVE